MDTIVFYKDGNEIGRDFIHEFSDQEQRDDIAINLGILDYDNFKFITSEGKERFSAKDMFMGGKRYDKLCRDRYRKNLSKNLYRNKINKIVNQYKNK